MVMRKCIIHLFVCVWLKGLFNVHLHLPTQDTRRRIPVHSMLSRRKKQKGDLSVCHCAHDLLQLFSFIRLSLQSSLWHSVQKQKRNSKNQKQDDEYEKRVLSALVCYCFHTFLFYVEEKDENKTTEKTKSILNLTLVFVPLSSHPSLCEVKVQNTSHLGLLCIGAFIQHPVNIQTQPANTVHCISFNGVTLTSIMCFYYRC